MAKKTIDEAKEKSWSIVLDGRDYYLISIGDLIIGAPNEPDFNYEIFTTKILRYPIQTLRTAAERLSKRIRR